MFKMIITDMGLSVKSLLLMFVYVIIFPLMLDQNAYMGTIGALAVYVVVLGLLAAEERDKVDLLYRILPVRARDIVGAKYVECVLVWGMAMLIDCAVLAVRSYLGNLDEPVHYANSILSSFITMSVIAGITLPIVYKYGYTRSRIIVLFLWLGLAFASPFLAALIDFLMNDRGMTLTGVLSLGAAAAVVLLCVSAYAAVRIYKKK